MTDRIDMHTHVFNVRYLPVAGILVSKGCDPSMAQGLAALLNAGTADGICPNTAQEHERDVTVAAATEDEAIAMLSAATPSSLLDHPDVRAALAQLPVSTAAAAPVNAKAQFALLYKQLRHLQPSGILQSKLDILKWFQFLTHSEREMTKRLFGTYGDDVHLFVHHMMDMEHHYSPGDCQYDFVAEQLPRMQQLVSCHKGRLLTFVAYGPDRPHDLDVVARALDETTAAGVKFYPPNGYKPNEPRHHALYGMLGDRWPLFAHCTPVGMEAIPHKTGAYSDPAYWKPVLEEFKGLRLCLAHAGGDAPWFHPDQWKDSFAQKAVELASRHDNVYLEFGYHDDVLHPEKREAFISRLSGCINSNPKIASRIMYGTDWHMIEKIPHHGDYLKDFEKVFDDDRLSDYKNAFFYTNAVSYLNLAAYKEARAKTHGDADPVVQHVAKVIARAEELRRSPVSALA